MAQILAYPWPPHPPSLPLVRCNPASAFCEDFKRPKNHIQSTGRSIFTFCSNQADLTNLPDSHARLRDYTAAFSR